MRDCGDIPDILNGNIQYFSPGYHRTTYNAYATYNCDIGYTLNGDEVTVCAESGWSGTPPICDSKKMNNEVQS